MEGGVDDGDPGEKTHTYCASLSGLLPPSHRQKLLSMIRCNSQVLGDLVHRGSLLLNYHYTRLCEEGFPLDHAPLNSPFNIIIWAQKLVVNPHWSGDSDLPPPDRHALSLLRASAQRLERRCLDMCGHSFLMPHAQDQLGGTIALDNIKSTLVTNATLHLQQAEIRLRAAITTKFGEDIKAQLAKGQRKLAYSIIMGRILPDDPAPDLPVYTNPEPLGDDQLMPLTFVDNHREILAFIVSTRNVLAVSCVMANHLQETIQSNRYQDNHLFDADLCDPMEVDAELQNPEEGSDEEYEIPSWRLLLRQRPLAFLPFYHFLQKACAVGNRKVFTLLPVNERRRVHLKICPRYWANLCRTAGLDPKVPMDKTLLLQQHFPQYFHQFAGSISTDGFKASVRFGLKGKKVYKEAAFKEKQRVREGWEQAKLTKTKFAAEACDVTLDMLNTDALFANPPDTMVGIDPGRRKMVAACIVPFPASPMTAAELASRPLGRQKITGMGGREMAHWQGRFESQERDTALRKRYGIDKRVTDLSLLERPTTIATWLIYITARTEQFGPDFDCYDFNGQRSRWKFQSFSMRQRALDEVANRLCGRSPTDKPKAQWTSCALRTPTLKDPNRPELQNILVGFGNGSVQTGACAKGGMKVPLKALRRHLAAKQNITFSQVNEAYTTKICSVCPVVHRLSPCHHIASGPLPENCAKPLKHEVHGILACQGHLSYKESGPRRAPLFLDRDVSSSKNHVTLMCHHLAGHPRPAQFGSPFWADANMYTKQDLWPPSVRLGRPLRPCAVKSH